MGSLDGVNGELARRFLALQGAAAGAGFPIGISSGRRSRDKQAQLRRDNGCPNVWTAPARECRIPTAIPGTSNHEFGLAIDISGSGRAKEWVAQNAARFGLGLPVSGEDWHLEMLEDARSRGFTQAGQQQGAIGFDMNWTEQAQDPEALVDSKIQEIMGAITGAQRDALAEDPLAAPGMDPMLAGPAAPEVSGPAAPEVAQPMAMETTTLPAPAPTVRLEETTVSGGGAGAGGQWQGNVPPPGYEPAGSGVGRWRDVALAALAYTGQDPKWVDLLLKRMNQESGGNPGIVNNWDSNAQRGDPSIGLMQNIGSAFPERAKELTGRGIRDGFANIVASIRYTLGRYGTLSAWGKAGGY
jgi:hypothetical protein